MKKECFEIIGGNKLFGEIRNQTSKNATLPIMSASILASGVVELREMPDITDIDNMISILEGLGALVDRQGNIIKIDPKKVRNDQISESLSKSMRSSVFLLGSMLSRFKSMRLCLPGGCQIGSRPIDIHINSLKRLGVKVEECGECISFDARYAKSGKVRLRLPSVGATENLIEFACLLPGKTTIMNPAREPEIVDLANFLNKMGAKILGAGTKKITIYGVDKLEGTIYTPMGDRIVSGTIMTAVAIAGGDVTITNACPYQNEKFIKILCSLGCQINIKNDIIHISRLGSLVSPKVVSTDYYPGFPTDLQSMILALACYCEGNTIIKENIYENRFLTVSELQKMGARIDKLSPKKIKVVGRELSGAELIARDLRGGASLVLACLGTKEKSVVQNIHFIDRGYDHIEIALTSLGADIRRI